MYNDSIIDLFTNGCRDYKKAQEKFLSIYK